MKKRLRKKIARKVTTIKVSKGILQISDKICPICGIHIVKKNNTYVCMGCNRVYFLNEVAPEMERITKGEQEEILKKWKQFSLRKYSNCLK